MSKLTITGIIFIALGLISSFIQETYYGYVDANGLVHDSLFLPLTFIFAGIGLLFLLIKVSNFLIHKLKSNPKFKAKIFILPKLL